MAMRLQEIHPSLVHYPLAFLPLSIGADLLARSTGNRTFAELGRYAMALAAGSAAVAAVAGLAAQEEVDVEEGSEAYEMLVTHRNMNLTLVGAATGMAMWRWREREASPGYLALGLGALGAVAYSAYLGGKMVYQHGLGVEAADGLYEEEHPVPEITRETAGEALRYAARDVAAGAKHAAQQLADGQVAPRLGIGKRVGSSEGQAEAR